MSSVPPETQTPHRRGVSPALIVFLIFPLVGLIAAAAMILSGGAANIVPTYTPPTPAPVTLPPMPTPINLADTPAVDFQLTSLDGDPVSASDYRGRVVFINFWATWCEPCRRELPAFETFVKAQPEDGAVILAVNLAETTEQVQAFLDENGVDGLTVLMDIEQEVADDYGIRQLPVTYVVDQNGVIRYPKYGEMTLEELEAYTEALNEEAQS